MMNEGKLVFSTNHVAFMQTTRSNPQITSFCSNHFPESQKESLNDKANSAITRTISDRTVCDHNLSDDELDILDKNSIKGLTKSISSDPRLPYSEHWKAHFHNHKLINSMPNKMSNKMSLQRTRQITLGGPKINRQNFKNIEINGQKIQAGVGFPTKMPIIIDKKSEIIRKTETSFDELENIINRIKSKDNTTTKDSPPKNDEKPLNNSNSRETGIETFEKMEISILNEISTIKTSINKLLEDRKEIQMQHRMWIKDMKKKIYQAKQETMNIENQPSEINNGGKLKLLSLD